MAGNRWGRRAGLQYARGTGRTESSIQLDQLLQAMAVDLSDQLPGQAVIELRLQC